VKAALDTATGLTQADAPLVELAKTLATQIDSSGPRETGSIIMTILADTSVGAGLADASAHRTGAGAGGKNDRISRDASVTTSSSASRPGSPGRPRRPSLDPDSWRGPQAMSGMPA